MDNNHPGQNYRSRDDRQDRSDRDQGGRSYDDRRQPYASSSHSQGPRNPFSGSGNDRYDSNRFDGNGGGRDYSSGSRGSGGDRYGNGGGGYRGNGASRGYGGSSGGGRDRYGSDSRGGDRGGDSYGGGSSGYGRGNGQGHNGGGQRQGSYDRRSGSGGSGGTAGSSGSSYDAGSRKRPMDDSRTERSPMDSSDHPSKRHQGDGAGPSRGGARREKPSGDQKRERRDRYAILKTKPADAPQKQGCSGEVIPLRANYFELRERPNYEMVMYRVDFEPEIELAPKRKYLMYTQRDLFGAYLYDTKNSVYLTHRLPQDLYTVDTEDRENVPYKMTIKFGTIVSMDTRESLQVLNLILRRAMEGLNLQLIGRNLFDPKGLVNYNNFHIQLWPGYTTSIRQHEQSVLLCAEITSKVMRNETIYDILRQCGRDDDFQSRFENEVLGLVVLTDYNNKTYKITDIDFNASPSDTFETKNGPITFIQYYKDKYGIVIRNPTQPMLITRSTDRQRRGGEEETISLIPELCRPTGLTDQQRNNFQLMKAIADQTRMDPRKRMMALAKFNQRLQTTPASQDILRSWNMELDRQLIEIDGRKLKNENIIYGREEKEVSGIYSDWQNSFRDKSMFLSYPLRNWVCIVPFKMKGQASQFYEMIKRVSRQMQFEVSDPRIIDVDDRLQSYNQGFDQASHSDPQLIMALVNNNNADKYASIKKLGCCTYGTPTQVVVQKTLGNRNLMSIATKVAIQLNCKLGGTPWLVSIPMKGMMTVGIDVSRDTKDKNVSWGALVASMDLTNITKESYFSCVSRHQNQNDFTTQLAVDMIRALRAFHEHNGAYPSKIVLYRDGVGDGQLEYVYHTELAEIKSKLEQLYAENSAQLKFVFIIVSKKVNTRIFGRDEKNPPSGTVVDTKITLPERQDFYLISQTVRQGTVSPTAYNVIYDSLRLPADRLQQLTYKQCHLYYNWAGTVRVPAVCQCAHKLSFLVAQFLHQEPLADLERKLYFL